MDGRGKERLEKEESFSKNKIFFDTAKRVPYSFEVLSYLNDSPEDKNIIRYETDLLVYQKIDNEKWKPRIIIEGKIDRVTTHDAITYSQKASSHKNVHPLHISVTSGHCFRNYGNGKLKCT